MFKSISAELSNWFKQVFHIKNSWILLPGLIAVLTVYADHHFNVCTQLFSRGPLENLAPWLVLMILLVLVTNSLISRNPLVIYLAALALVFLVRELDDMVFTFFDATYLVKTKNLVSFLLAGMGLAAFVWHEKLFASLNRSRLLKVSLFGVLWTYFFSQLIARRWFKGVLPDERLLHVPLEETAETSAHLFFLLFALCCFVFISKSKVDLGITL